MSVSAIWAGVRSRVRRMRPPQIIALVFLAIILLGSALLCLPAASKRGEPTDFLTSLFTATSATCVTGLVRVDTGTYWSGFGQAVILVMIQIGGLGFMTIASIFFFALRRKIGLRQRLVLARTTSAAIGALIDTGTVTRTYEESLTAFEPTDGDALVVTDTATLEALEQAGGSYTILRDYGDVFWDIRMNINDVTNNFANPFTLPEAPQRGAGRK